MSIVYVVNHPLLEHSLSRLRDKKTGTEEFRRHASIVSQIMIMEATKNLALEDNPIETPLSPMKGSKVKEGLVFVPVLRAGISMLFPARDFLPWASVGFIGLERDEETAIARQYYQKFPQNLEDKKVLVLDPMLATGGSLVDTISALYKKRANDICVVCIVAAPEGIQTLKDHFRDITIYTAAVDSHLNENKYIVPGLGDFGDRYFGTT